MVEDALGRLLLVDVVAINVGVSLVLASLASGEWLRDASSPWADAVRTRGSLACRAGLVVAFFGLFCAVWLQAAVMVDEPPWKSASTVWTLVRDTHFGHAAAAGAVAWAVVTGVVWKTTHRTQQRRWLAMLALAALLWSRSVVAHAGSHGDLSWDVAMDVAHLFSALLWVGMVLFAAALRLPASGDPLSNRCDASQWVAALSSTATVALVVVVGTGIFKVWRTGLRVEALVPSEYGWVLGSKVALVALAAALGAFNRFRVLPSLFDSLRVGGTSEVDTSWRSRLSSALKIEALVLLLVLVAAAVLAGTEPPSS